jgi:hypothetical protein
MAKRTVFRGQLKGGFDLMAAVPDTILAKIMKVRIDLL